MDVLTLFALQILIYAAFPFYLATLKKGVRAAAFYILISIYLLIGGFLGSVYSFPITDSINISGGNLAYGSLMMTTILFVIIEKDVSVLRNAIRVVFGVNVFKVLFFTTISWALQNEAVLNPNNTSFAVFRTSVFFTILGGSLIILELFLFVLIFEQLKKRIASVYILSILYTLVFFLVLCLDGVLFPTIAFGFSPQIVNIVIGGVRGKFFMATGYSIPILIFMFVFRKQLAEYFEEPILMVDLWRAPKEKLIEEIQRQQQELEQSEEKYRNIYDGSRDGIFIINLRGDYVDVNKAASDMVGYQIDELKKMHVDDLAVPGGSIPPEVRQRSWEEGGEFQVELVHKDGHFVPVDLTVSPLQIGGEQRVLGIARDITERKQVEQVLAERAQEMAALNVVSTQVSRTLSVDQVVSQSLQSALTTTQSDAAFILMREGDDLMPAQIIFSEPGREFAEFPNHKLGECLCGLAVNERSPIFSADIYNDMRCTWDECKKVGLKSAAALPLFRGDEIFAVLGLGTDSTRDYEAQREFLDTITGQIAKGLQNAILHEQVQRHARELEQHVAERTQSLNEKVAETEQLNEAMSNLLEDFQAANEILDATGKQLTEVNRELEAFSYSVSHDLRAPLRAIDGFSQILLEDFSELIPEEAVRYLDKISEGAQHMGSLIQDLLDLSRLSRKSLQKSLIEPMLVVEHALAVLAEEQEGRNLEIEIDDLPPCQGDLSLIKQVYLNLIGNALKFTRLEDFPVVEIGWEDGERETIYFVKDNGVGFDMEYAMHLFGVFQRLHPVEQFEGTGVGLAIVQRIIRRHGGRVWAEAELNKGATFYFTIPTEDEL